jgi:broad specificity phosphatase PhoE
MLQHRFRRFSSLPIDLVIVRNGISQGFDALQRSSSCETARLNLAKVHSSRWRLTDFGRKESTLAGQWIRQHFAHPFDAYLTGEYLRSLETAASLELPGAKWIPSLYLRPRDFGAFSDLNRQFNNSEFEQIMKERARDAFYWTPPGGESIAHLSLRTERILHWIRSQVPANGTVVIVTHKDVIETIRIRLEVISQMEYQEKIVNVPQNLTLFHGSILQYTRRDPETGMVRPQYGWRRIVTPWLGKPGLVEKFEQFERKVLGNEELQNEVLSVPSMFQENLNAS